jgi:hypothetical protein
VDGLYRQLVELQFRGEALGLEELAVSLADTARAGQRGGGTR